MRMSISSLRRGSSNINNWMITRSLSRTRKSQLLVKRRKTVGSGRRCKRLHKRGNSRWKKSSRGLLTYSI